MTSDTCCVVSKSLICFEKLDLTEEEERNFCLGLEGWCPCHVCSPEMEKKSLSLKCAREPVKLHVEGPVVSGVDDLGEPSSKLQKTDERFDFNVTSDDLFRYMEGETPLNTERSTMWAVKIFDDRRIARNTTVSTDLCPENIFTLEDSNIICQWLCKFVTEVRKGTGQEYTPRSLYLILSGLQRHMRKLRPLDTINLFKDIHYKPLKNVCDSVFKQLHQKGIGTETKETPVLSKDDEDELWKKVFSLDTPKGLLQAVFFCNGKNFCLRGGQEQRNLKISQLKREVIVVNGKRVHSYVYQEFGSKNRQGNFSSLNLQNKIVRQHQNTTNPERCHVQILDKYLSKIPKEARAKDTFYLTPLLNKPKDPSKPWYTVTPVGRNRLNGMLKEMCQEAGLSTNFTNHSLRAYGATTLFQAGVPEKLIQQRTGHRCLEALRQYERTSESQLADVSNLISNPDTPASTNISSKVAMTKSSVNEISPLISCSGGGVPNIVLKGCTFSGCSIAFSGPSSNVNNESVAAEVLKGLTMDDIFDD